MSVVARLYSGIFYSSLLLTALCDEDRTFTEGELAAGIVLPPLLLSLLVGSVVAVVILCKKRVQLMEACSKWKRSTTEHSENNENVIHVHNSSYYSGLVINSKPTSGCVSTPTSPPVSLKGPLYESVKLHMVENDEDVPNYDVVEEVLSGDITDLQTQSPKKEVSILDRKCNERPVTPYAVSSMNDKTTSGVVKVPHSSGIVSQKVKEINSITSFQKAKEINGMTTSQSANDTKLVVKKHAGKPACKPVCAPKPDVPFLTSKFISKKGLNGTRPSSLYSGLDMKTSYASLEPHIDSVEVKGNTATSTNTKLEDYSHLVH